MTRRSMVLMAALLLYLFPAGSAGDAGQEAKTAPVAQAPADVIIVKLLGESITEKQMLMTINQLAARAQQQQQATPQQLQQKDVYFYKDALETLISGALLKNEAREQNLTADKAKVEESYLAIKKQFPSEAEFLKALQGQGLTDADVRKSLEDNQVIQQVMEPTLKTVPAVTDVEIQKFYDENPQYFNEQEQAHAAHIFMRVDKAATPEQKAAIRKKLEEVRADIEGKKITFAEAAAKYSEDKQNAQNSGDLGTLKRGDLLPDLEKAIFSAKPGTLTPIVETEFGLHIINILELKPAGKSLLAKVKPNIQQYLEQKARTDATRKHIEELKGKAKIETLVTEEEWTKRHTIK
jgi:peptidyl-prolyl cis-trans isomerase C